MLWAIIIENQTIHDCIRVQNVPLFRTHNISYQSPVGTCGFLLFLMLNCAIHSVRLKIRSHGLLTRSLEIDNQREHTILFVC